MSEVDIVKLLGGSECMVQLSFIDENVNIFGAGQASRMAVNAYSASSSELEITLRLREIRVVEDEQLADIRRTANKQLEKQVEYKFIEEDSNENNYNYTL